MERNLDRVKTRLSRWKMNMLSIGGRLTFVKSVLGSIPIYNFSIFKVPKSILNELECIRRKFFNGHEQNCKKITWVSWNKVLKSKENGGLGVSSLYAINRGLLMKWVWRFVSQNNSLWARSIKAIHGDFNIPGLRANKGYNSCWKSIISEVSSLSKIGVNVLNYMSMKIGDGKSCKFWYDRWNDEGILKDKYPRVFSLESCKNIFIADKVAQHDSFQSFRRAPRGGIEQEQFDHINRITKDIKLNSHDDCWTWNLEKSGNFSVASVRKKVDEESFRSLDIESRWNKFVPIKVNVLVWKLMNNFLPTRFNISRKGIVLDSIICPNCDVGVETVGHLFFSCSMAREINYLIGRWWSVPVVDFDCFDEWVEWIVSLHLSKQVKLMLEDVFYSAWWMIWWFRNSTIFKDKVPKKAILFDELQSKSFLWCRYRGKNRFSWIDWLSHPNSISL